VMAIIGQGFMATALKKGGAGYKAYELESWFMYRTKDSSRMRRIHC
jgi:hypothetical protein